MKTALILLVVGVAVLSAEAQNYGHGYQPPPSCGRCDYKDYRGRDGPAGPKV